MKLVCLGRYVQAPQSCQKQTCLHLSPARQHSPVEDAFSLLAQGAYLSFQRMSSLIGFTVAESFAQTERRRQIPGAIRNEAPTNKPRVALHTTPQPTKRAQTERDLACL